MLRITIPAVKERWDEINEVFLEGTEEVTLELEHSLVSLSKIIVLTVTYTLTPYVWQ